MNSWLSGLLKNNRHCQYGKKYGFDTIASIKDYQLRVPIIEYEDIAKDINAIADGQKDVLFAGSAVAFEQTSGSSGAHKLIPYSSQSLIDFQQAIVPWLDTISEDLELGVNTAYWAISPAMRQLKYTKGGIPIGLEDGAYLGTSYSRKLARWSVVPPWVGTIDELSSWQLITLYFLLCSPDLCLISVWSPTFFLVLLRALDNRTDELEKILRHGGNIAGFTLAENTRALTRLNAYKTTKKLDALWSNLKVVSCWSDGSSKKYYKELQNLLPYVNFRPKGLLSTEGVVTIPDENNKPILAINSGFFEFKSNKGELCLSHQLIVGENYEVILTTAGGLYRYKTGDIVTCRDYHQNHPVLHFVGRTGIVSDMVGEKLTDSFASQCMAEIEGFGMLVATDEHKPHYQLVVDEKNTGLTETIKHSVEAQLKQNPQYAYARKLGQLGDLSLTFIKSPLEQYLNYRAQLSTRLGDIKIPALSAYNWITVL